MFLLRKGWFSVSHSCTQRAPIHRAPADGNSTWKVTGTISGTSAGSRKSHRSPSLQKWPRVVVFWPDMFDFLFQKWYPIGSTYGIFTYMYYKHWLNSGYIYQTLILYINVTTPFKGLQNNIFLGDLQLTGKPWDNILWRWRDLDVQRATFAYRRVYRFMECEPFWNTMVLTHLNAKATNLYQFWVARVSRLWNHPRVSCGFFSSIARSLATQIRHISQLQKLKRVINLHVIRLQKKLLIKMDHLPKSAQQTPETLVWNHNLLS